ncbi:hypothetical protein ACFL3X_00340 [Gemmatimonadota bacterium]
MTDIFDPNSFEKVCVNAVLEAVRESGPLRSPRAFYLCQSKTTQLTTSFRYHLTVIFFEHREELLSHLRSMARNLASDQEEEELIWSLMQTFIHSLVTPITIRGLIEDSRATTEWLAQEVDILSRTFLK